MNFIINKKLISMNIIKIWIYFLNWINKNFNK